MRGIAFFREQSPEKLLAGPRAPMLSMGRNVCVKRVVPLCDVACSGSGGLAQKKVDQVQRRSAADGHGLDAGYEIDNNMLAGHAAGPHFHGFIDLFGAAGGIQTVSAAYGGCPGALCFDDGYIHLVQKRSDRPVHSRSVAYRAGFVNADVHPMIVGEGEVPQPVEEFPQGNGGNSVIKRAEPLVAPCADIDNDRACRQLRIVPAARAYGPLENWPANRQKCVQRSPGGTD